MQPIDGSNVTTQQTNAIKRHDQPSGSSNGSAQVQQTFLETLKDEIGEQRFQRWFGQHCRLKYEGDCLHLAVASPFLLKYIQRQFRETIVQLATQLYGPATRLEIIADPSILVTGNGDGPAVEVSQTVGKKHPANSSKESKSSAAVTTTPKTDSRRVRRGRRFQDLGQYVVGPCNQLAYMAAADVGEMHEHTSHLLYLHGGVGVGKTHLLEGVYKKIKGHSPHLQVTYLTAEQFTNFFTQALLKKSLPAFRSKFRSVDVLIVDDIEFLDSKQGIQEEFQHTFDELTQKNKHVILAGSSHPRLLTKLSDELTTRFVSGLVCRIETPDYETRRQFVSQFLMFSEPGLQLADDVLDYVANRFRSNIRELQGAINCLRAHSKLLQHSITLAEARQLLSGLERDCIKMIRLEDVERAVCKLFQITATELKSKSRAPRCSQPRMVAMYVSRKWTQSPYHEIGKYYGNRNHSTVMSAEKKVESLKSSKANWKVALREWPVTEVIAAVEHELMAG